ncbi:LIM domain-binding protein 2 Chi isoform X2 [Brevipalpus obovatus]|uniref:LIM domain-binding protein 2 Chi isoform X2 n=1 Tax=Brevipalpus obovatus TaxID=246614 RepID=UPI003D9E2DC3
MRPMFNNQCMSSGMCPPQCPPTVMAPGPNSVPPNEFYPPPFSPYMRRNPFNANADFRIYEFNRRLQSRPEDSDNIFWDNLISEFFEDDATLTLVLCLEDGPKQFTIGRTLIPRYFRTSFEEGVTDLSFHLRNPKESFHNSLITLDCEQCTMITHHGKTSFNKVMGLGPYPPGSDPQQMKDQMHMSRDTSLVVLTEGKLSLKFNYDDLLRIKSWHFTTISHQELIPRNLMAIVAQQDQSQLEQLSKNITRQGFTNSTLNYLRLCSILEPMQELMARAKAFPITPRDCLKTTLFQKWQRMISPPENQRPPSKRRKRKSSNSATTGGNSTKKKNSPSMFTKSNASMSPGPPSFSLASQDVMVVGEPSLMGGEFGDEDERLITRLENTQYDPSASAVSNGLDDSEDFVHGPGPGSVPSNVNAQNAPPTSWSGPSGSASNPGSVSSNSDNRGPNSVQGGGPSGQQEDRKPSPQSLNH